MAAENIDELFEKYLDICNEAIEKNRNVFPYKQIWDLSEKLFTDHKINLAVYEDRPEKLYRLRFKDRKLAIDEDTDADVDVSDAWKISSSYLKKVIENPEKYINHPANLDWDWLKSRLAMYM